MTAEGTTLLRRKQSPDTSPVTMAKRESAASALTGISVELLRVSFGFDVLIAQPAGAVGAKLMLIHIYKTALQSLQNPFPLLFNLV